MTEFWIMILLATLAGAAMPIGGLIASVERIRPKWLEQEFRHSVIAFGGGILLSAVALVLVPDGMERLSILPVVLCFTAGGVAFLGVDVLLSRSQSSASNLVAMLTDFIPEALALGAGFASGDSTGYLLALLIAFQNLPEGFNAYREMIAGSPGQSSRKILLLMLCLVPLGPLSTLLGYYVLAPYPAVVGAIMLLAAGGILYLTFEDIAPQARLKDHRSPALGVIAGFLIGIVGHMLLA